MRHIAVIDIGKTNAKLAMVDLDSLSEVDDITRPNHVMTGPPWPHFDTEMIWAFLQAGLRDFGRKYSIDGISVTTHGACAALLGADGDLVVPILDYEHDGPDQLAAEYDLIRTPFSQTGSPRLLGGLNIGAQLYWQFTMDPTLRDRVRRIVTYPQYWAHRLTGVAACDLTSIGCHTDLWNPIAGEPSTLLADMGIAEKLAPVRKPADILRLILPAVAEATGLPMNIPVACGIHDSNASLYPHILGRRPPFSVVSTGTWVIAMVVGGEIPELDPTRDTLINVNALGQPVPSARFMGGREFEMIRQGAPTRVSADDVAKVLAECILLLPAVVQSCGPFQGSQMRWHPTEPDVGSGVREAALSFYLALVTAECLTMCNGSGPTIVEGPFARNPQYLDMLQVATGRAVMPAASATGTSIGAALLFQTAKGRVPTQEPWPKPALRDAMSDYAARWRAMA